MGGGGGGGGGVGGGGGGGGGFGKGAALVSCMGAPACSVEPLGSLMRLAKALNYVMQALVALCMAAA